MRVDQRQALATLAKPRLLELAAAFQLDVPAAALKDDLVDVLARSRRASFERILESLLRDELKAVCRAAGLDDSGREKAAIVDRILGRETAALPPPPFKKGGTEGGFLPQASPLTREESLPPREKSPLAPLSQRGGPEGNASAPQQLALDVPLSGPVANKRGRKAAKPSNGATLGFEEKLWTAADKLRNNLDAAEYKHVVLGLIFLKYISDAFEEIHERLLSEVDVGADPEDPDEYRAENVFWVPKDARWTFLAPQAKEPTIGKLVDDAMEAIERDNPSLKGVLPKNYARPALDKERLGELVDLVGTIGLGQAEHRSRDVLGRVYEYFLSRFASAEGKKGGQFYTPQCVVRVLVEMLAPYRGRVLDPCCGSGGMFVQSEKFVEAHGGRVGDISVYGQESNPTTWRLAKMNLAIRGIDNNLGKEWADSFKNDLHRDLKADYLLANPPFNSSDWGGEGLRDDVRWHFGTPPVGNANFAWVQHFIHHLAPAGMAGFVLANGSMSSQQSGEGEIRKAIVEADLVDCMVALPGQLFYSTQIPVCLWFIARDKRGGTGTEGRRLRDRGGETLFIDARKLGSMVDRVHRDLTADDVGRVAGAYHDWRGDGTGTYADVAGFCKSATLDQIREHHHVLTPGRYVGAEEVEDDGEPFADKMERLVATLGEQFAESARLEGAIRVVVERLGYGE
jgi:type I restriction enzyme M protein